MFSIFQCRALHKRLDIAEKQKEKVQSDLSAANETVAQLKVHFFMLSYIHVSLMNWLLPTAREGNVFTGICHSVHNRPHGYLVTVHPCYSAVGTHPTGMLSC